jgi:O-antigen/teichoic acid export membrane protein
MQVPKIIFLVEAIRFVLCAVLEWIFISAFGLMGAALGLLISYVIYLLVVALIAVKYMKKRRIGVANRRGDNILPAA